MALATVPARGHTRWVRLGLPLYPLPVRLGRAAPPGWHSPRWPRYKTEGRQAWRRHGRLAVVQDLGGERHRERELRMQREQLIHLARVGLLGELSAALVHELNQPLAAILVNAQAGRRGLRSRGSVPGPLAGVLDDIVEASQRAVSVIQHMRSLFVQRETQLQLLDLNAVARDAVKLARSSLAEHGVRLALSLDPRPVLLRGDPVQLEQVLLNLVLNACDAMDATPQGMRRLAVATHAGPGPQPCLTVTDTGSGIAQGLLERIFDSFFTTKPHGLGVGLSVSREIVAAHGGRIEAVNQAEGGAMFRISLPLTGEQHHD